MQLTRFDRWLREKFVYETYVYTLRPPSRMPRGVKERRHASLRGSRFQHLYVPRNDKATNLLISLLNEQNQIFTTKVVERKNWYSPLLAPEGKSVTWWLVSTTLFITFLFSLTLYLKSLWDQPEIRKNLMESIKILQR